MGKITGDQRRAVEIFDLGETEPARSGVQILGFEIAAKRFAVGRHTLSHCTVKSLRRGPLNCVRRIGVVEYDFHPAGQLSRIRRA